MRPLRECGARSKSEVQGCTSSTALRSEPTYERVAPDRYVGSKNWMAVTPSITIATPAICEPLRLSPSSKNPSKAAQAGAVLSIAAKPTGPIKLTAMNNKQVAAA